MNSQKITAWFFSGMLLIHAGAWWQMRRSIAAGYPDFTIFYSAGKMVRMGMGHQLYNEAAEWRVQREVAPEVSVRTAALPYMHAPFEAIAFLPFSYLPYTTAYLLWDLAAIGMLLAAATLLRPHCHALGQYPLALWSLGALAFPPVFLTLLEGQDTILLLFLYTLAFLAMKKNALFWAGCWLALGLFRFHLVAPFLLLTILLKKWRLALGFIATTAALAGISAAVVGWRGLMNYPAYIWSLEHHRGEAILAPKYTVAFRGLLDQFFAPSLGPRGVLLLVLATSAVTVLLLARKWRSSDGDSRGMGHLFSLGVIMALLVGYHTLLYDLTLLLLPAALTLNHVLISPPRRPVYFALLVPIAVLFFTPLYAIFWIRGWEQSNLMALVLITWGFALWHDLSRPERPSVTARGQSTIAF